jgi:hypothetical protein
MNNFYTPQENERVLAARESFSGRLLTDRQFDDAMTITGIIEREIRTSGTFKDKLGDYAYAFARSEKFDAVKSESILRDLFKERTGQTMNQMREDLAKREENVTDDHRAMAYSQACGIGELMENGVKMSFHRAYAHQAQQYAEEIGVTDACAKRLMRDEFASVEGVELSTWGKELDEQFYRPQIEAAKAEKSEREKPRTRDDGARQSARPSFRSRSGPQ